VTVLTVVGFSVAVADPSYLVVAERLVFRTDTREHTIGLNRRALRRILVLRSLRGHYFRSTCTSLRRRLTSVPSPNWTTRDKSKSPSASNYQLSVGLFPILRRVLRRTTRLPPDRRRRRPPVNDSRAPLPLPLPLPLFAAALRYRVKLLLALLTSVWGSAHYFWL